MRTFECKEDITAYNKMLLESGSKISLESEYILTDADGHIKITLTLEQILNDPNFVEIIDTKGFSMKEVDIIDSDPEKEWRLELTVTTTRKKLKELEAFLHKEVPKIIG